MINVTHEAKVRLHEILDQECSDEVTRTELAVRLIREERGSEAQPRFAIALDRPSEGDQVVEHEGRNVLLVDPGVAEATTDLTLDVVETETGRRLTIKN